ncbi:MAG: outer membrane beta-barrel protein [Alphaproteobacteria bacterium]|nr:outer membrane beta-barrel protein [Alphaproteobacteria bacterium]
MRTAATGTAAICLAALALAGGERAARSEGFYVGGDLGAHSPTDQDLSFVDTARGNRGTTKLRGDTGFTIGGSAGYDFDVARLEIENRYLATDAKVDSVTVGGVTYSGNSGWLNVNTFMANAYLDTPLSRFGVQGFAGQIRPFVGGGAGVALIEKRGGNDWESAWAWQGTAGIGLDLNRNWTLSASYRFAGTGEFSTSQSNINENYDGLRTHAALIGFRYTFGSTPSFAGSARPGAAAYDSGMPPATQVSAYPSGMPGPSTLESQPPLPMAGQPMMHSPLPPLGDAAPGTRAGGQALMGFGQPGASRGATADTMAALPPSNGRQARASRAPAGEFRASNGGRYGVQVGAFRDRQKAMAAWPEKQAQFGLAGLQPKVVSANVPGKGRWERLYASGLSKGDADRLCSQIKARGDFCAVAAL